VPAHFPFLDSPGPIAFAHRGSSPDGLENTLAAVERIVRLGFGHLETDVRASRDGVALLMHDPTLDRTTDRTGRVHELPWDRIAQARVGGREPVPRLDELLGSFPTLRVNLHIKTAAAIGPMVEAVRRAGALDRVCAAAFQDRYVAAARARLGPRLCTALGTRGVVALWLASLRSATAVAGPVPIAPCAQVPAHAGALRVVDRRFVDAAHHRGVRVHVWTVNGAAEMHRLLDLGVDGLMTDEAEVLRDVLVARDAWGGGRAA
jgi:glycerophosphoryl diester phosphodiesterase